MGGRRAQAEYTALDDATKEIMFVRERELHKQIAGIVQPAIIYEDNSSAINISQGTESTCSRFLLTKYFAIRQMRQANKIDIRKVSTVNQRTHSEFIPLILFPQKCSSGRTACDQMPAEWKEYLTGWCPSGIDEKIYSCRYQIPQRSSLLKPSGR